MPPSRPSNDNGRRADHAADDDHAGHDHGQTVTAGSERRVQLVFLLTAGYALVQAVGGWMSGSLALIADAGDMVSDAATLLLALIAYSVAARGADVARTFGWHRVRALAALANGASLLLPWPGSPGKRLPRLGARRGPRWAVPTLCMVDHPRRSKGPRQGSTRISDELMETCLSGPPTA